jgi:hypothetical protein
MKISRGSRSIELDIPFDWHEGEKRELVRFAVIRPMMLGQSIRWLEGEYATAVELLSEMLGWPLEKTKLLRYPDADFVFESFLAMVPENVRQDIAQGIVPLQAALPEPLERAEEGPASDAGEEPSEAGPASEGLPAGPDDPALFPNPQIFPPTETNEDPADYRPAPDFIKPDEEAA